MDFIAGSLDRFQVSDLIQLLENMSKEDADYLKHKHNLTNTDLTWYQCFCIEHSIISKGTLISLGTGLGKTYTAMGYIIALKEMYENKKFLYICMPITLTQTENDFINNTNLKVITLTGQDSDIKNFIDHHQDFDVLLISYQTLYNIRFCNYLLTLLPHLISCVVDEAHNISQDSLINSVLEVLLKKIEYKVFLTATPITVSPVQVISLMNLLDDKMFPQGDRFLRDYEIRDENTFEVIDYKHLDNLSAALYSRYVYWEREELGIKGNPKVFPLLVKPTNEEQKNCTLQEIPTILKGQRNTNQTEVLKALLKDLKTKNLIGLIYTGHIENHYLIKDLCSEIGVVAEIMNGTTESKSNRDLILDNFHRLKYDVLITSLTTSLNLDCDYVVFWENTNLGQQVIGRCQRGFLPKDLLIYFILTDDTVELEQFDKNVWRRHKWLREALSKDTAVFDEVHNRIQRYKLSKY